MLPGEAYVKGFIRNYANSLGLNGAEYVELYRKSQSPVAEVPDKADITSAASHNGVAQATADKLRQPDSSVLNKRRSKSRNSEVAFILAALVLIAGGGVWWYVSAKDTPEQPPTQQSAQSGPVTQQPVPPSPAPAPQQTPTQQSQVKPAQKPILIAAKFNSRSWIQVYADEKEVYEGFPKVGETLTWQAERKLSFKAGNAGGVELTQNGRSLGTLGKNGEVIFREFTASVQ